MGRDHLDIHSRTNGEHRSGGLTTVKVLARGEKDGIEVFGASKQASDNLGSSGRRRSDVDVVRPDHDVDVGTRSVPPDILEETDLRLNLSVQHASGEEIRLSDEIGDERSGRRMVDRLRCI